MKKAYALGIATLTLFFLSCDVAYKEFNPMSAVPKDIFADLHRLSFGTSSGDDTENWARVDYTAKTIRVWARNDTNNAGKIAGSEDGLTYVFKEVDKGLNFKLSADITVLSYGGTNAGLTTSNGQEGFGLMARDYVPQYPGFELSELTDQDLSVSSGTYNAGATGGSGNMVMVGGIKRGVRAAARIGVSGGLDAITDPLVITDSSKSKIDWFPKELGDYSAYPRLEDRPDFPPANSVWRLSLEKTNSGFICTINPPAGKGSEESYTFSDPEMLVQVNPDKYYVGFFAARAAEIEVSNIQYSESNSNEDAPFVAAEQKIYTPSISIATPGIDSDGQYRIVANSNVPGYLSVTQDGLAIEGASFVEGTLMTEPTSSAVEPFTQYSIPVYPLKPGDNNFKLAFYPKDGPGIANTNPIIKTIKVHHAWYFTVDTPIYVSPEGSQYNLGSRESPLDIDTAIAYVLPGQKIVMLDGTYSLLKLHIPRYNDGSFGKVKSLVAENRNQVFVDFGKDLKASGAILEGNYWILDGLHIRNTPDKKKGLTVMGWNNTVRYVKTYNNGDTGLQISGRSTEPKAMWPKNNTIEYCDSYNNMDAAMEDADGFAAKLTVGDGNVFNWCVAHHNNDDGWDLFTKKETGTIGVVTIKNSIAYLNGTLLNGQKTLSGRNGFKLGGEGLSVEHEVINSIAFWNGAHGFTSNSNGGIVLTNCTSFDNGGTWNLKAGADSRNFTIYDGAGLITGLSAKLTGILSLYSDPDNDGISGDDPAIVNRKEDKVVLKLPADGYAWLGDGSGGSAGISSKNKNDLSINTSTSFITSLEAPFWNADLSSPGTFPEVFLKRKSDGSFDLGNFLKSTVANTGASM